MYNNCHLKIEAPGEEIKGNALSGLRSNEQQSHTEQSFYKNAGDALMRASAMPIKKRSIPNDRLRRTSGGGSLPSLYRCLSLSHRHIVFFLRLARVKRSHL